VNLLLEQCTTPNNITSSDAHSTQSISTETTGQTPTNINVVFEDGEWWYVGQADGGRRRIASHNRKNNIRMFVAGKYIPKSHPLHKPGNYKSWEDAYNHTELDKAVSGYVYVITNHAWPAWVKIGMAVDATDRCKGYQTSCPFRNFKLRHSVFTDNRRQSEAVAHKLAGKAAEERRGEWFKMPVTKAINVLNQLHECN